ARPQDVRGDPRTAGSRRAPPHHDAAGAAPLAAGDADALGADGRLGPGARLRCGRARVLRGWDVWGRSRWSVRTDRVVTGVDPEPVGAEAAVAAPRGRALLGAPGDLDVPRPGAVGQARRGVEAGDRGVPQEPGCHRVV